MLSNLTFRLSRRNRIREMNAQFIAWIDECRREEAQEQICTMQSETV